MGLFKFFLLLAVIIDLSQAMDTNITSQVDDVKEINKILDQEKTKPGSFIKSIIADLKQCSNQKMLFLNYLTIKSAYWWDAMPKNRMHDQTDDLEIQKYKDFLIDRKFRSSIYDREGPKHNMPLANLLFKSSGISYNELVNSWQSASQKIKFYEQKDIGSRKGTIEEILDYGYPFNVSLDTYPSVYQIMKAAKLLKYQKQQGESPIEKCYLPLQEIEKKSPPQIILDTLKALFQKPFYQKFSKQNHPISRIVQDHLLKLHHKAQTQYFPEDVMGKDSDDNKTTYSRSLLFHKVLSNIEKMIRYMSTFDIDINKGICEVKGLNVNNVINDPYYLYAQFYEITNDLLFTLMYTEFGYGRNDFDRIFSRTYINRIPILQKLHGVGNIVIQSFPMRSGMDAFVNASMSIDHMPYPISIAPKVSGLDNTVYYEINRLLTLLKPPPNIKTYISLNKEIKLDDIKLIKDDFIINYISNNIENLKFIHEQDMIDKNKETLEKFIKTFTENPFTEMSGWYYYDEKLPKPAKSDIVLKIIDEIRKTTVYAHLFEIKEYKGKYFLIVPRALENQSQLFKNVQRKYTLIESIFSIDNHPSFVAGTTTETEI